jgi:hypothetical protein
MGVKDIEIKLNKVSHKVKLNNRAMIYFENIKQKSFASITDRLDDIYTLMYSCLTVNNENFKYSYTEFLDVMDDNINELTKFVEYFQRMTGVDDKKKVTKIVTNIMK